MHFNALISSIAAIVFLSAPALGQQEACRSVAEKHVSGVLQLAMNLKSCHCGADLEKIKLTTPKELKLKAICDLADAQGRPIDLQGKRIAFDHPGKNDLDGARLQYELYLSGDLTLTGEVRYEPSEGGSLNFSAHDADKLTQSDYLKTILSSIELDWYSDKFMIPDENANCLTAQATIKVHDLQIVETGSDIDGATPKTVRVLKISKFAPCKGGE